MQWSIEYLLAIIADFMVSRIGPIAQLLLLVDLIGPISVTIKSTAAATEIEE